MTTRLRRRALPTLAVVALGIAAPTATATAATTLDGRADFGPVLVGDSVLWAENADGGGVIKKDGNVVASFPAPPEGIEGRVFGSFDASPTRLAYSVTDMTLEDDAANTQVTHSVTTPYLSVQGGVVSNPLGTCQAESVASAVDGDTVAFALSNAEAPCKTGVYLGGRRISGAQYVVEVRVAGPYVAWRDAGPRVGRVGGTIAVASVATGKMVASFPISGAPYYGFDIDEKGNIVAEHAGRLLGFSVGKSKKRVLSRAASSVVATAGGRVAYITGGKGPSRLNLIDLKGKVLRRVDRFSAKRTPTGGIGLTADRIAWSVSTGSVFTQTL